MTTGHSEPAGVGSTKVDESDLLEEHLQHERTMEIVAHGVLHRRAAMGASQLESAELAPSFRQAIEVHAHPRHHLAGDRIADRIDAIARDEFFVHGLVFASPVPFQQDVVWPGELGSIDRSGARAHRCGNRNAQPIFQERSRATREAQAHPAALEPSEDLADPEHRMLHPRLAGGPRPVPNWITEILPVSRVSMLRCRRGFFGVSVALAALIQPASGCGPRTDDGTTNGNATDVPEIWDERGGRRRCATQRSDALR